MSKVFVFAVALAVLAAILTGLYLGGSPSGQRQYRMDEKRTADLRTLSRAIERRWDKVGVLPQALEQLIDGAFFRALPTDPDSNVPYVYAALSDTSYHLCAIFSRPSLNPDPNDFWIHKAGSHCFTFELYRENDGK